MEVKKLAPTYRLLEQIDKRVIQRNDDRVVLVVGDEGVGKSTLMATMARMWQDIRERPADTESVLGNIVWGGREAFKERLKDGEKGDMIAVQDAPHVLFSRDVMVGEQKELEKSLMDIRFRNYLIVLGFQDWTDIPSGLVRRRAKNTLFIPRRGVIRGFNRDSMDTRYKSGEWPEPEFEDRFPSLDGSELWSEFRERDEAAKLDRLEDTQEQDPDDAKWDELAKVALRAMKPWDDSRGMNQAEVAEIVDYSQTWVSRRKQEWDRGYHREMFADDPRVPTNIEGGDSREGAEG